MRLTQKTITGVICFPLLLVLFLLIRCEEEKPVAREYPRLSGTNVINISDSGATFCADLYSMGTEVAAEYGFVWGFGGYLDYTGSSKVILGKPEKAGIFTADIRAGLMKDRKYTVRPFVKTEERIVYGPIEEFASLGSNAPIISGFFPDSAGWGDTVMVSGKNFSSVTGSNEVKLNLVRCLAVKSTDTTLFFVVDPSVTSLNNIISVELAGNVNRFIKDTFRLIPPRIVDFQPRKAYWGDTIIISGKYLRFFNYQPNNLTKLGAFTCQIVGYPSDNILKIKVSYDVNVISSNLMIYMNGLTLNAPSPFELLPPFYTLSPAAASWGNTIALNGRFNTIASRNKVYFNSTQSSITSVTATRMLVIVPYPLTSLKSAVKYNVAPFNVVSSDSFSISPPVINSFLPKYGPSGTIVTIRGKCFSSVAAFGVKFGSVSANVTSINDSVIVTKVPLGVTGPVKITVTASLLSGTSIEDFQVTIPKITGVFPLTATFNDDIIISGENFIPSTQNTSVSFGTISAAISSVSENQIVARVPPSVDSIPKSLIVVTGSTTLSSVEKFVLSPPQIQSLSPGILQFGSDITITGNNFNPDLSKNRVSWNGYLLNIKSASKNEIVATVPASLPGGIDRVEIEIGKYIRRSELQYEIKSPWTRVLSPSWFVWDDGYSIGQYGQGLSFSSNGLGYMMDFQNGRMITINPVTREFKNSGDFGSFKQTYGLTGVVNNDTLYIIGGTKGICRYDKAQNKWNYLLPAPVSFTYGVAFSINGHIYYGLTFDASSYDRIQKGFWKYTNNTWIKMNDFPENSNGKAQVYFTINNKGYVVLSDNKFWEYNPESDSWTQLTSFPGAGTDRIYRTSFVIGSKAYVGLGLGLVSGTVYNDIWCFDSGSKTWSQAPSIAGGGRYNAIGFSIGSKGYIGFGNKIQYYGVSLQDLIEFDPNYPLK